MHPALAVETARARINLAATLSEAKRHRAALMAIKKAQNGLSRVIAWGEDCGEDHAAGSSGTSAILCTCSLSERPRACSFYSHTHMYILYVCVSVRSSIEQVCIAVSLCLETTDKG